MKLYEIPRNSIIQVLVTPKIPPASLPVKKDSILTFLHTDGMYSTCKNQDNETVYIAAWTPVKII